MTDPVPSPNAIEPASMVPGPSGVSPDGAPTTRVPVEPDDSAIVSVPLRSSTMTVPKSLAINVPVPAPPTTMSPALNVDATSELPLPVAPATVTVPELPASRPMVASFSNRAWTSLLISTTAPVSVLPTISVSVFRAAVITSVAPSTSTVPPRLVFSLVSSVWPPMKLSVPLPVTEDEKTNGSDSVAVWLNRIVPVPLPNDMLPVTVPAATASLPATAPRISVPVELPLLAISIVGVLSTVPPSATISMPVPSDPITSLSDMVRFEPLPLPSSPATSTVPASLEPAPISSDDAETLPPDSMDRRPVVPPPNLMSSATRVSGITIVPSPMETD